MGIGLALAGGGLKCVAHIGALKALEELNISIDCIAGTSSGSLIAMLYALGFTSEEMEKIVENDYGVFTKFSKKPFIKAASTLLLHGEAQIGGLSDGYKVEVLAQEIAQLKGCEKMSDLKMPVAIATVDTISTKECIFLSRPLQNGPPPNVDCIYDAPIGVAVRASAAFPGIFTTCDYGSYNFIDGGTKDNLPVKILKSMGAEKTVSFSFKLDEYQPTENLMSILLRTCDIFSQKDVEEARRLVDIDVEINADGTSLLTIDDMHHCLQAGYDAVMQKFKV